MKNPFKYAKYKEQWHKVYKIEFRAYGVIPIVKLVKVIHLDGRYIGLTIFKNEVVFNRSILVF